MKPLNKKAKIRILIYVILALLIYIYSEIYGTGAKQLRNLDKARAHATKVEPTLRQYDKFKYVQVDGYTGGGGQFIVFGLVKNQEDIKELENIIKSTNPPVNIYWSVNVSEEEFNEYESLD